MSRLSAYKDRNVVILDDEKEPVSDNVLGLLTRPGITHDPHITRRGQELKRSPSHAQVGETSRLVSQIPNMESLSSQATDPTYFVSPTWRFPPQVLSPRNPVTFTESSSSSPRPSRVDKREVDDATKTTRLEVLSGARGLRVTTEITDEDDFMDEEDFNAWMVQQAENDDTRRQSSAASRATSRRSSAILLRNLPITAPLVSLDSFTYNGIRLGPNVNVELRDGDFMRVIHIVKDTTTSDVSLRGWKFRRARMMNGLLDRKLNEVCWTLHVDGSDPREALIQGMEIAAITEVMRRRRIRMTNQAFPALSWRDDECKELGNVVENERVLVCRYKYLCFYPNAKAREAYAWCEKGIYRLRAEECDRGADNNMEDETLRNDWRGATCLGGAREGWLRGEKEFLRQEKISHSGVQSKSSLELPSGVRIPLGDPMERGSVASLITQKDLPQAALTATQKDNQRPTGIHKTATKGDDVVEVDSPSSATSTQQQRGDWRMNHAPLPVFNDLPLDPRAYNSDDGSAMFALSGNLRESSIQSPRSRHVSPQIVEIDAQVKTSSSLGTFKKRYEGKITSTYHPKSSLSQKRPADDVVDSHSRPKKRFDLGHRLHEANPDGFQEYVRSGLLNNRRNQATNQYSHPEPSPSNKNRTADQLQPLDSVEGFCNPLRARDPGVSTSGLLTPVSCSRNRCKHSVPLIKPFGTPQPGDTPGRTTPTSKILYPVGSASYRGEQNKSYSLIDLTQPRGHSFMPRPALSSLDFGASYSSHRRGFDTSPQTKPQQFSPTPYKVLHPEFSALVTTSGFVSPSKRITAYPDCPPASRMKVDRKPNAITLIDSNSTVPPSQDRQTRKNAHIALSTIQKRYTFGDCFCGAGGMSRGAVIAGLRVDWGFDFNPAACQSYASNFFGTSVFNVWANQFSEAPGDHKVDICHLSPPCQFFSDAHTIQGKDDEMNTASLFAISNLLKKTKPRVVTLEQTSGLLRRHPIFFNAVVNMFTSQGFSIRWRVMNCADFGLPQRRLRLFVIASCPGEALPPFPMPTHSSKPEQTGLKPWTTINEAIGNIPAEWANHDVENARPRDGPPQSGDKIATCITTSGGGIIHPSGARDYTQREFACLQSFPLSHKFQNPGVKRQIGNAVPPAIAAVLLGEIKKALTKTDGLI